MVTVHSARPAARMGAAILVAAMILTIGIAPLITSGADHLDAPALGSVSVDAMDNLSVSKVRGQHDINDVYIFDGRPGKTVLAMTVNPAINVLGPTTFATGRSYEFRIDKSGDAVVDSRYTIWFGEPNANGVQRYSV